MRVLIIGATGFIGQYLLQQLSGRHEVFALCQVPVSSPSGSVNWLLGDLRQPDVWLDGVPRMDAIVYLAQSRNYRLFPEQAREMFDVNVMGVARLLEFARMREAGRFLYVSSANVYRQAKGRIGEEGVLEPTTFYARTKWMAEQTVSAYSELFPCTILRLFTVYGKGQQDMLIPRLIERVRTGVPVELKGEHGLFLSPIHVSDVCRTMRIVLERSLPARALELFNLGGDELLDIPAIAYAIGRAVLREPVFKYLAETESLGWVSDSRLLKSQLDVGPFLSFAEGIKLTVTE